MTYPPDDKGTSMSDSMIERARDPANCACRYFNSESICPVHGEVIERAEAAIAAGFILPENLALTNDLVAALKAARAENERLKKKNERLNRMVRVYDD